MTVRGSRLFVDLRGDPGDPPLLYLHGGPGMSCYAFMIWQGELLSGSCYLIGLDQRGVLRSDPLTERLTEQMLVEDCEAVREALGIPQWTVLGHSFGGRIALRYACAHPDRVSAVIFENPCWDFDDTEHLRLPAAAAVFDELGDLDRANRCRELARTAHFDDWRATVSLLGELDEHYDDLYLHHRSARDAYHAADTDSFPEELLSRTAIHNEQAMDSLVGESLLGLLPKLTVPATLIKGRSDLITGPAHLDAFRPHGAIHWFTDSGHFVQLEKAHAYADLITRLAERVES